MLCNDLICQVSYIIAPETPITAPTYLLGPRERWRLFGTLKEQGSYDGHTACLSKKIVLLADNGTSAEERKEIYIKAAFWNTDSYGCAHWKRRWCRELYMIDLRYALCLLSCQLVPTMMLVESLSSSPCHDSISSFEGRSIARYSRINAE